MKTQEMVTSQKKLIHIQTSVSWLSLS